MKHEDNFQTRKARGLHYFLLAWFLCWCHHNTNVCAFSLKVVFKIWLPAYLCSAFRDVWRLLFFIRQLYLPFSCALRTLLCPILAEDIYCYKVKRTGRLDASYTKWNISESGLWGKKKMKRKAWVISAWAFLKQSPGDLWYVCSQSCDGCHGILLRKRMNSWW